ncbi:hypothetical protein LCGC14_2079220 [marine sediment metagenome]|uniref:Uncharacterized protein n=1 Tax=marine sediment metagenome TaxID=412755 RepID=A0A0F9GUG4_9ZZZZ
MAFLGFDLEEAPSDLQPVFAFESDQFQEFDEPGLISKRLLPA